MKRLLIFGGTTEGRLLCQALEAGGVAFTVCVATAYGQGALAGLSGSADIRVGRMTQDAMEALMRKGYALVIDATHPYATEVSKAVKGAARNTGMDYRRLLRPASPEQSALYVPTIEAAAAVLARKEGNILAATGVKQLDAYCAINGYAQRVYPRVLPTEASIARCAALGFPRGHIIAMQGPFSQVLNEALIRQFDIQWLVTKDGGDFGGFMAKLDAANRCGIGAIVIGRPPEMEGDSLEAILAAVHQRSVPSR